FKAYPVIVMPKTIAGTAGGKFPCTFRRSGENDNDTEIQRRRELMTGNVHFDDCFTTGNGLPIFHDDPSRKATGSGASSYDDRQSKVISRNVQILRSSLKPDSDCPADANTGRV